MSNEIDHVVSDGDTLQTIAQQHDTTAAALAARNALVVDHELEVGQIVVVPDSSPPLPQPADEASIRDLGFFGLFGFLWFVIQNSRPRPHFFRAVGLAFLCACTLWFLFWLTGI